MAIILTVVSDFGDYARGAQITDASKIDEILSSDHAGKVVRISAPDLETEPLPHAVAAKSAVVAGDTPAHPAE